MQYLTPKIGVIMVLTTLLLSGCSTEVGHFVATEPVTTGNAVLYIYRPEATSPGLVKPLKFDYPDIQIDGKSIGSLKYDQYVTVEIKPGAHTIKVTGLTKVASGWAARDINRKFVTGNNPQLFMKLQVEYNMNEMNLGQPKPSYSIFLTPMDADDAIYEIRNTDPAVR